MLRYFVAAFTACLVGGTSSAQGLLKGRLAEPTIYEATSRKQIADLEFCVANAISATTGIPGGAYRDGEDRVIIFGNRIAEVKVFLIVTLIRTKEGTKIEVRGRNAKALEGFKPTLETCI